MLCYVMLCYVMLRSALLRSVLLRSAPVPVCPKYAVDSPLSVSIGARPTGLARLDLVAVLLSRAYTARESCSRTVRRLDFTYRTRYGVEAQALALEAVAARLHGCRLDQREIPQIPQSAAKGFFFFFGNNSMAGHDFPGRMFFQDRSQDRPALI